MKRFANFTSVFCLFFYIFSYASFAQNMGEDFVFKQVESRGNIPHNFLKSWKSKQKGGKAKSKI
ncbi:MAG: hypothetical protein DA405_06170 [Bacteroidetes bacterium]|nr:MAG: hypothetical protein DA405_06170 [Bacteroidota bacterium]